jgi:hypothetical protein
MTPRALVEVIEEETGLVFGKTVVAAMDRACPRIVRLVRAEVAEELRGMATVVALEAAMQPIPVGPILEAQAKAIRLAAARVEGE